MIKERNKGNNKKDSMYFSEAIKQIDKRIDYNEYSEINSSDYFKGSLNKAEDEIDKMMSSPLITNYKKYKNNNLSINLLKKRKDIMLKKLQWINEKAQKENDENKKKKIKSNSMMNNKKILNQNITNTIISQDEQKKVLNTDNDFILPQINNKMKKENLIKENSQKENNIPNQEGVIKKLYMKEKSMISRNINNLQNNKQSFYFTQNRNKDLINLENNNDEQNISNKQFIDDLYLKCIKGLKTLEFYGQKEKQTLKSVNSYRIKKTKNLIKRRLNNKDIQMKKFLIENINELNKSKNNKKEEQLMKDYVELKLKKDPILQISDKFAYFNRKPLLNKFNYDDQEEKMKNSPLAKLKKKDDNIMRNLEKDNRNKNLLLKRLDEDQIKYVNGGYFIMTKEKDNNFRNNKFKKYFSFETDPKNKYENGFFKNINDAEQLSNQQNLFFI